MSSSSISASETGRARARAPGRYLALVGLFTACLAAAFLGLVAASYGVRIDTSTSAVAARLLAKMNYAASQHGRRILVFAGSQAFYNVSAESIERATGRSTVNLGTHGAESLPFLIWQIEQVARPGDVVILPLEHSFYREAGVTTYGVEIAHAAGLPLFGVLPPADRLQYLRELHLPRLLRALGVRLGLGRGLSREDLALNVTPRGDLAHPPQERRFLAAAIARLGPRHPRLSAVSPDSAERLAAMLRWAEAQGITVFFAPPGVMDPTAPTPEEEDGFAREIKGLGGAYLKLGNGGAIPAEAMLDTVYHAAAPGAGLYTASMIVALCRAGIDDLSCDRKKLAAAGKTIATFERHGYVFGDDPRLARLHEAGLDLKDGESIAFSVASFRDCRNRLRIEGTGELSAELAGQAATPRPSTDGTRTIELPDRAGLVGVTLRAGPGGAALTRLRRESDCGARTLANER